MAATDAIPVPKKNTAYRLTFPLLDADGDPTAAATIDSGLASGAGKARVSKDGGASVNSTNSVTEIDGGFYFIDLTATGMNADTVAVMVRTTTAGVKNTPVVIYPQEIGDIVVTANQILDKTGYLLASTDSPTSHSGTAQAGAAGSITLASAASAVTDFYAGAPVSLIGGAGVGQTRTITAYNGTTKVATVDRPWATNPDNSSSYTVLRWVGPALNPALQVVSAAVAAGGIAASSFAAGAIDANAIATDAITSAEIAASGATKIAAAVWDEPFASHLAAGTFGRVSQDIRDGTAQAGAAGSITLDAGANANDGFYTNQLIQIVGGTGAGQARQISGYTGATKIATVSPNWTVTPDNTSTFVIAPFGPSSGSSPSTIAAAVWDEARTSHVAAGSFGQGVASVQGNVTGSVGSVASGGITAASFAANAIDANAIATDAIGSAELAATAAGEIAAAVWDELRSAHTAAGSFGRSAQVIRDGTAQAGAGGTITLDAGASASDNFYNACLIEIVAGAGAGQARFISGYTGATKVASVQGNWLTAPDNSSVFVIYPYGTIASIGTVTGNVNGSVGSVAAGGITAASFAANAIDANAIATDAIGAAELAATAATEIAGAVWDQPRTSNTAPGTFGRAAQITRDGTAQAGAAGSITLDAGASATDGFYTGLICYLQAGTGAGQVRPITGYTGATKVATVSPNWATNPDATSVFVLLPFAASPLAATVAGAVWDEARTSHTAGGSFGQGVASVQGNVTGSIGSVASGGITAASFAAGAIDANAIATDAIGSAELAATAATEIAAAVWDEARSSHVAAGSFGQGVASVQGNVTGSVGSATAAVTVGTNNDKTGYSLTATESNVLHSGTAQAGAATTITLAAGASATNDLYKGCLVKIVSGTGAAQARTITAYNGTTKVATVDRAWATNPDNTSGYGVEATDNPSLSAALEVVAGSLAAQAQTDVKAQVVNALTVDTYAELAGVPAATSTLKDKINWLFILARNKVTSDATTITLRNDGDSANVATSTQSDSGTVYTRGKFA